MAGGCKRIPLISEGNFMRTLTFLAVTAATASIFCASIPSANAQVSINIGLAPSCPYGYFDAAPYGCAPAGYYGPEWFNGDAFVGAGPWFHGPSHFRGNVNNNYHPEHGYKGSTPNRGDRAESSRRVDKSSFRGNEARDGHGRAEENKR
jgi:hypothetical protein